MKAQTAKPQTVKDFMQLLGLEFNDSIRRGVRFELKNNNFQIDGFRFPSDTESRRYVELKLKALRGEIQNLIVGASAGISYKLSDGEKYYPTFVYFNRLGQMVLEDCRKMQSSENLRKIEQMEFQHGLKVKIIKF